MTKKQRLLHIKEALEKLYPDADCSLRYTDPWQLLVSAILATQCTDKRVNMVTPALFARYKDVYAFAEADEEELKTYIRSTGFYNNKAKNLIGAAKRIYQVYGGKVPDEIDELVTLPGVGRKIANLIVGDIYKKPAIVVDTHAKRITKRLGLTENTDPYKIEKDLRKIVPPEYGSKFCHQLVLLGREYCTARKPKCVECPLEPWCRKVGVSEK